MEPKSEIRMPLKIGIDYLWQNTMGIATLPQSIALVGFWIVLGIHVGQFLEASVGKSCVYSVLLCLYIFLSMFPVAALTSYTIIILAEAGGDSPRDVVLSSEGISIVQGDTSKRFSWTEIDLEKTELSSFDSSERMVVLKVVFYWAVLLLKLLRGRGERGGRKTSSLWLGTRDGKRHLLATSERRAERESLQALFSTILSKKAGSRDDRVLVDRGLVKIDVLACPDCGAPVCPRDAETVGCHYCGRDVAVPADLRTRLTDLDARRSERNEESLRKLLSQPGAEAVHRRLGRAMKLMFFLFLALVTFFVVFFFTGRLDAWNASLVTISYFVSMAAIYYIAKSTLVGRRALRLTLLDFTAAPPARRDTPYLCRVCGAPLPHEEGRMLAHCLFCESENIVGIDLVPAAGEREAPRLDLQAVWQRQVRERRRAVLVGSALLLALVLDGACLFAYFYV